MFRIRVPFFFIFMGKTLRIETATSLSIIILISRPTVDAIVRKYTKKYYATMNTTRVFVFYWPYKNVTLAQQLKKK